jgi:hypothetical protein
MKKIGVLFGREMSFPQAVVERINAKNEPGIVAEIAHVDEVMQSKTSPYAVIIDRISHDVPFYRSMLKTIALTGTRVINNPFWWSADEKFINNTIAQKVGVPVPKTYLLPSRDMPDDTSPESFRNLKYPMDWKAIFEDLGFPAYMKPHAGGGWKSVYKVTSEEDFFEKFQETGQLVMMLQENIEFDSYWRCYCIGRKYVKIMPYEPRNPPHLRYVANFGQDSRLIAKIEDYVLRLNNALGYEFNTVEFAVREGVPYAIDFCNPAPDAERSSVGEENFEWVVEHAALYAIECAKEQDENYTNLSWGSILIDSVEDSISEKEGRTRILSYSQYLAARNARMNKPEKKKAKRKTKTNVPKEPLPLEEEFPELALGNVEVITIVPEESKSLKRGRPRVHPPKPKKKARPEPKAKPIEEQFPYLADENIKVVDVEVKRKPERRGRPRKYDY